MNGKKDVCRKLLKNKKKPWSISFHGVALESELDLNAQEPAIFTTKGLSNTEDIGVSMVVSPSQYDEHFKLNEESKEILLVRSFDEPLSVNIDFDVEQSSSNAIIHRSQVTVFVSEYNEKSLEQKLKSKG